LEMICHDNVNKSVVPGICHPFARHIPMQTL
jgi:hypothetical protein